MGLFDSLLAWRESRRLRQSVLTPLVCSYFRDSYRYYENGRFVTVSPEMLTGPVQRVLYRSAPLRWSDSGFELSEAERKRVFDAVTNYFVTHGIKWKDA
jgi:hypothetical protein